MADENISIVIQDKVAPTIQPKIDGIATSANNAQKALNQLQQQLNALSAGDNALNSITGATQGFNSSLNALQSQMVALQGALGSLTASLSTMQSGLQTVNNTTNNTTNNITNMGASANQAALSIAVWGAALREVKKALTEITDALVSVVEWRAGFDRVNIGINQVSGSTQAAAANSQFLSTTINKLGLDMNATTNSFIKFAASTQGTVLQGEKTQQIFTSISEAASVLHLTADQTQSVFVALEQMASKGTVSMQELRLQLANALPGALQIAANALGVTTAQLEQMVSKGQVVSDEFLPKFAQAVHDKYAGSVADASVSAQSSLNKFNNAWTSLERTIGASSIGTTAAKAIDQITAAVTRGSNAIANFQKLGFWKGINTDLNALTAAPAAPAVNNASTNLSASQLAAVQAQQQAANLQKFADSGKLMTPGQQLAKNLKEVKSEFDAATKGVDQSSTAYLNALQIYNDRVANLNQKSAAPGIKAAHKQFENELSAQMVALEASGTAAKNLYSQQQADLQTSLANQTISQQQYITQLGADKQAELQTLIGVAQKEADLASGKDQLAARQRYLNQVKDLQAQEVTAALNTQKQLAQLSVQTQLQAEKIVSQLDLAGQNKDAQNNNALLGLTVSSQQLSDLNQLQSIIKNIATARNQFTQDAKKNGTLDTAEYINGIQAINAAEQQQLANEQLYFQQRDKLTSDWYTGFQQGINQILTSSGNVAQQTSQLVTSSFNDMSNALANFATTGKLNFTSLVQNILSGLIKIQLQTAASGALSALFGGGTSGLNLFGQKTYSGTAFVGDGTGGFASGGFTGVGSDSDPAGIVHKNEFVVKASAVRQPGALSMLQAMNSGRPGYANGGLVGSAASSSATSGSNSGSGMEVNVYNNMSDKAGVSVQQGTDKNGNPNLSVIIDQVEGEMANRVASGRGKLHKSIGQAYNLRSQPSRG